MKKRYVIFLLLLLTLGISVASFWGCSASKEGTTGVDVENTDIYEFKRIVYSTLEDGEAGQYTCETSLLIYNDEDAMLSVKNIFNEGNTSISEYTGKYNFENNRYTFSYIDPQDSSWTFEYYFDMKGDEVEKGNFSYSNEDSLVGSFKCDSGEFGEITLTVDGTGVAIIDTKEENYSGSIYNYQAYDGIYEVTFWKSEDENVDWMITVDGDSFVYEDYSAYIYSGHPESIDAFGDIGELHISFDDYGVSRADVEYNGVVYHMEGNYYMNDNKEVDSLYMSDPSGVELSVTIENTDGRWNYFGNISFPLSAG